MPELNREEILVQTKESYNSYYKCYRAEWCRKSGLPMYQRADFETVEREGFYTKSRAKREKVDIDSTKVVGWYRRPNGYVPLFKCKIQNTECKNMKGIEK